MTYSLFAVSKKNPKFIFRIWEEPSELLENGEQSRAGWAFCVAELEVNASSNISEEKPIYDGWDVSFDVIIQYPKFYTDEDLLWFDENNNTLVDLNSLAFRH